MPDPNEPPIKITMLPGCNASLQATYLSHVVDSGLIGNITFTQGWGKAIFHNASYQLQNPSSVSAEGITLKYNKGAYSNNPGSGPGIDFGSQIIWQVKGRQDIPDFNYTVNFKVPEIGNLNVGDSLNSGNDLALIIDSSNPFTSLGPLDSITYLLVGKKASFKIALGKLDTAHFASADLKKLGIGWAHIQAEAFRAEVRTFEASYKVGFVNKGVINRKVWVY